MYQPYNVCMVVGKVFASFVIHFLLVYFIDCDSKAYQSLDIAIFNFDCHLENLSKKPCNIRWRFDFY